MRIGFGLALKFSSVVHLCTVCLLVITDWEKSLESLKLEHWIDPQLHPWFSFQRKWENTEEKSCIVIAADCASIGGWLKTHLKSETS